MNIVGTNDSVVVTIGNIVYGRAISIEFENWAEVSEWWSSHPNAYRQFPNHIDEEMTIEEHNNWNHNLEFPCKMTFMFPIDTNTAA